MIALLTSVAAVATGAVILTTHAAATNTPTGPAKSAAVAIPGARVTPAASGAPQVPEESATIRDDPTLVPDPKQSADNSVSFPNDI
jgi:hypothetical protein